MQTCIASHNLMQLHSTRIAHPHRISPKSFLFRWVVAGVTGVGNEYPLYTPEAYVTSTLADCKRVQ